MIAFASCSVQQHAELAEEPEIIEQIVVQTIQPVPQVVVEKDPWTDAQVEAMVLTLAGECYDDKLNDKRLVCEVILNRTSAGAFPDTVEAVVSAPNQFDGYWTQSRDVSDSDIEIATQALEEWYSNDCQPLSDYLYFCAGSNRENVFRVEY